jgi:MraZ protein
MFLGEYQHSLDAKGRVILPAKFREQLEGGAVMARGLDGCLMVYPPVEFHRVADRLTDLRGKGPTERQAARTFFAGATDFVPDRQGRVAIPPHLRDHAGLERDVVVAGGYDHLEIWDAERYRAHDAEGAARIQEGEGLNEFM